MSAADPKTGLKEAILQGDSAAVSNLLDAEPAWLEVDLWPVAIFRAKSLSMTTLLLERGLNPNECSAPRKPLHLAVYQCLPDIVELLLRHGADPNLRDPLGETPLDLLDSYEPRPVGDPDSRRIRKLLLNAGARGDIFSFVRAGDADALTRLLAERPKLISARSPDIGLSPLCVAARSGRPEIADLLIKRAADVNEASGKGNTPLWFACQSAARSSDRIAVAQILLEAGADANFPCEEGTTALNFAAARGPAEMVELLISHGAQKMATDHKGI